MAMCTDTLCHPEQSSNASSAVGEVTEYEIQRKRPTVRFSFMGRNVEDLTDDETDDSDDDEGSHSVVDDGSDDQQDHATLPLQSLEDEKRMIREQLMLITSELGQLTGADSAKVCLKSKNKRPHTFPDRKERQKIMSIRISLPQEGKSGNKKRIKTSHFSPNTVMSATSVESFGLQLNKSGRNSDDSETDSVDTDKQEQDADPLHELQGIASATPTACNDVKSSKQHNTDSVVSSGFVASFQMPAWRLAPEIDLPQFRLVEDYGEVDPHFGPGYDFMSAAWSKERILPEAHSKPTAGKVKRLEESESLYQKSYRTSKRRVLPCDSDIEDTSDEVYQRLHHSQEKEEKERMTAMYNERLKSSNREKVDAKGKDESPS